MGISRNNGEGYPDPTAHIAVRNVEADAKKLKINYPTGYIELNLERFFPCPQSKAKKVFRLIHRYCTQTDKTRLLEFMTRRVAYYDMFWQMFFGMSFEQSFLQGLDTKKLSQKLHFIYSLIKA